MLVIGELDTSVKCKPKNDPVQKLHLYTKGAKRICWQRDNFVYVGDNTSTKLWPTCFAKVFLGGWEMEIHHKFEIKDAYKWHLKGRTGILNRENNLDVVYI